MTDPSIALPSRVDSVAVLLITQILLGGCATTARTLHTERLGLQDKEVAAGVAVATQIAPGARRYEIAGTAVDSQVLAFAASRSKLVPIPGGIEAPVPGDARDISVQVTVGSLAWLNAAEARLAVAYRVGQAEPVRCEISTVHSDFSPSWGIGKSADPACLPHTALD